ncbi:hypothetical protein D3C75_232700 [compost metagenome]
MKKTDKEVIDLTKTAVDVQVNENVVVDGEYGPFEAVATEEQPKVNLINSLFVEQAEAASNRGHQLSKTATLTQQGTLAMKDIMRKIAAVDSTNEDFERFSALVGASQTNHDAMDDLIGELYDFSKLNYDYLKELDEEELEKMLRSQQSKRSRAKSKHMDQQNYQNMMVAAVAETIVRLAANKPKNSGGAALGDLGVSDEDFEKLRDDSEELKKAIRNVQSKKSIMKSKSGFTEEAPRWKQLCELEERLKGLRDETTVPVSVQERRDAKAKAEAEEMLKGIDIGQASEEQAKMLLAKLSEVLATNKTEEDEE